jgi:hypothetical protein
MKKPAATEKGNESEKIIETILFHKFKMKNSFLLFLTHSARNRWLLNIDWLAAIIKSLFCTCDQRANG